MLRHIQLFATPWAVAHQAPLSIGILYARILEWIAMPSSRDLRRDRTQGSPALQVDSLPAELPGKPPICPLPPHIITSTVINFPPTPSGPFVTADEPTLTHYYQSKSIVFTRVDSWCSTFYRFGKICNDIYQPFSTQNILLP